MAMRNIMKSICNCLINSRTCKLTIPLLVVFISIFNIGCKKEEQAMLNQPLTTSSKASSLFDSAKLFNFKGSGFLPLYPMTRILVSRTRIFVDNTFLLSSLGEPIQRNIAENAKKKYNFKSIFISSEAEKLISGLVPPNRLRDGIGTLYLKSLDELLEKTIKVEQIYDENSKLDENIDDIKKILHIYVTPDAKYETLKQVISTSDTRYDKLALVIETPLGKRTIPVKYSSVPHVGGEWNSAKDVLKKGLINDHKSLCTSVSFEVDESGADIRTLDVGPPLNNNIFPGIPPIKTTGYSDLKCTGSKWRDLIRERKANIVYERKKKDESYLFDVEINTGIERVDDSPSHINRKNKKWNECDLKALLSYLAELEHGCGYFSIAVNKNEMTWSDIAKIALNALSMSKGKFRYVVLH